MRTAPAQATIEGHIELSQAKSAPVMNKRYEIVARGGVLSTNPPLAVIYHHANSPIPALPEARAELQPLINALLAKQPKDRPASASAVVQWVDQWLVQKRG